MNKLHILAQKCAALLLLLHCLVATAVHLLREKVQQQCISFSSMVRRISRLKPATYSVDKCSSSNTSPDFAQEHEKEGFSGYPADEYDRNDFDEWEQRREDRFNEVGWPDEDCEEWWDGPVYNRRGDCWEQEAVDEAIDEEQPGQYPANNDPNSGDIPW